MKETIKQLGYCNAYVLTKQFDNGRCIKTLVSYATPVAQLTYHDSRIIFVALGTYAHCSATTSKHVRRFFSEYEPAAYFLIGKQLSVSSRGYDVKKYVGYNYTTDFFYIDSEPSIFERETFVAWKDFYNGGLFKCKGLHRG